MMKENQSVKRAKEWIKESGLDSILDKKTMPIVIAAFIQGGAEQLEADMDELEFCEGYEEGAADTKIECAKRASVALDKIYFASEAMREQAKKLVKEEILK